MRIHLKEHNNRLTFWVLFGILIGLVFVRYVLQVPFPWVLLLAVVAVIALLGDRDEIIAMGICCIPLYTSLQYIYALAICIGMYVVKYHRDIRIDGCVIPVLLMLAWEWMHCFDEYSSVMGAVRALMPLVFCALVMFCPGERIHYPFVIRTLAICVTLMCVVVLSKLLLETGFNIRRAFSDMVRLGTASDGADVVGADFNPNFLGFLCIIASTGLIQLRMDGKGEKKDMAMVVFLLMCGLLTLSRTFLACLALMIALLAVANGIDFQKLLKMSGSVLGIALMIVVALLLFFPEILQDWIGRFQVKDVTSGRMDLMVLYHHRIFSNPKIYLFGTGIQSVTSKVISLFGGRKILGTVVPHNAIQEMVFCWGIPGLILFIVFLCTMVASARRKNPKAGLINFIPLILLLFKAQAGQLITTPPNLLILAVSYLSMCHKFEEKKEFLHDSVQEKIRADAGMEHLSECDADPLPGADHRADARHGAWKACGK